MRERRYSSKEILEQAEKLVADLKKDTNEWRKLPYRYICLFCGISPLRSAQPVLVQVRAHPNIEYNYQATAVRIPTAICHYVEADKNSITKDRFAQFTEEEYGFLYDRVSTIYSPSQDHRTFMLLMILAEELVLDGFRDGWRDLRYGYYAITMGLEMEDVVHMAEQLERLKIVKRLGMSRIFRIALSETEYRHLEDSAYAKQQEEIVERSKRAIEESVPQTIEEQFTVLTELNAVASETNTLLQRSYQINEDVVRQQLSLRVMTEALRALQEKESIYAGMATRIAAISKNYEHALKEANELRQKNNELKHLSTSEDKFYKEQKQIAVQNLEAMLSHVLSALEEYFSLPAYEKNKPNVTNSVKTKITRIVTDTIGAIEKGKAPE